MCDTCGCSDPSNATRYTIPGHDHAHEHHTDHNHEHGHGQGHIHDSEHSHKHPHTHSHEHGHPHDHNHDHEQGHTHEHEHTHFHEHTHEHGHSHSKTIQLEVDVLAMNNKLAERNRGYFEAKGIKAINLVSSPGSGKTILLEKTIVALKDELPFYVIEGDQQTLNDAQRIQATGAPVIQINTGNGCHLDATMINNAVKQLDVTNNALLIIENVGNLVCPSLFDLGEARRVVVISTTEGDDKPLKYPTMFHTSDICIINKTDLLPYVEFSIQKAKENALKINHHLKFFEVSAKTGEGMTEWCNWLRSLLPGTTH